MQSSEIINFNVYFCSYILAEKTKLRSKKDGYSGALILKSEVKSYCLMLMLFVPVVT